MNTHNPQPKRIVAQVTAQALTSESGEADIAVRFDVSPALPVETLQRLHAAAVQMAMRLSTEIQKEQDKKQKCSLPAFTLYL